MTIIERQHLAVSEVRAMCIAENLYSSGTNAQYDTMFTMVQSLAPKAIITAEDLYPIAMDILAHSDTDMGVEDIMYCLGEKITRFYEVIE